MKINLAKLKEQQEVVISSTDEIFKNYESLFDTGFSITIKRLGRTEQIDLVSGLGEDTSAGERSKAFFVNSIIDVSGFEDENGTPMEMEHGIRDLIWDYMPNLATILEKEIAKLSKAEEEKKSDNESDSEDMLIG